MLTSRRAIIGDHVAAGVWEVLDLVAGPSGAFALIASPSQAAGSQLLHLAPDGTVRTLDAPPLGAPVHGYGLTVLASRDDGVAAVGAAPPSILDIPPGAETVGIPAAPGLRLGDIAWAPSHEAWLFAAEDTRGAGFPAASLRMTSPSGAERTLWAGSHFVTRPAVAPDGRVAFMTWDLPWTPWEQSSIMVGGLTPEGELVDLVRAPTPPGAAVAQPRFAPDGRLFFLCDATGFFELWTGAAGEARPVTALGADIGLSLSRQASRSYDFLGDGRVLAVVWRRGFSELAEIDLATGGARRIESHARPGDLIAAGPDGIWYAGLPAEGPATIQRRDAGGDRAVWRAPSGRLRRGSAPQRLTASEGCCQIDAWFFRARPRTSEGLTIVNLHGGPKSLAPCRLKGSLQALRDAGHHVVELNYRGSAGFGRCFRDRLDGLWGIADVEDVLAIERRLIAEGLARRGRIVLRGASAGGYTALNVVSQHRGFAGAISYYGISDLRRLGQATHKFEAGYLKTLVGESDLAAPAFAERSPITRADRIDAPILLLQGADDVVTPPEQSTALAERVRAAGGSCDLHLFENEGHGFKRLETLRTCLELEIAFLESLA